MRWILDAIAVLTLAGLIGAVVVYKRNAGARETQIEQVTTELRRMELEVKYRSVTGSVEVNEMGWPVTLDPNWFGDKPPANPLVTPGRAWAEVAPETDAHLSHPRIRMTVDDHLAAFWYNPYQGIIRARVPMLVSDRDATELYNRINGSSLRSLHEVERIGPTEAGEESGKTAGRSSGPTRINTKSKRSGR